MRLGFPSRPIQPSMWISTKSFKVTLSRMNEMCSFLSKLSIDLYRFPSKMFPVVDSKFKVKEGDVEIEVDKKILDIEQVRPEVIGIEQLGAFFKARDIRCIAHASMYCNPISKRDDVVSRSIIEIEVISYFLRRFGDGFVESRLGPIFESKEKSLERFETFYNSLSQNAKAHLVIENDSYHKMFGTSKDLFELNDKFKVPIVFDMANFLLNKYEKNDSIIDVLDEFYERWKHGMFLIHYDNPYCKSFNFAEFWDFVSIIGEVIDFDILLTSKGREIDVIRARNYISERID